jgi:hypothetical protein
MDLPLGLKSSRGRPTKAVKGALNKRPKVNQKAESKSAKKKESRIYGKKMITLILLQT